MEEVSLLESYKMALTGSVAAQIFSPPILARSNRV